MEERDREYFSLPRVKHSAKERRLDKAKAKDMAWHRRYELLSSSVKRLPIIIHATSSLVNNRAERCPPTVADLRLLQHART
jgi:hypothetical protein